MVMFSGLVWCSNQSHSINEVMFIGQCKIPLSTMHYWLMNWTLLALNWDMIWWNPHLNGGLLSLSVYGSPILASSVNACSFHELLISISISHRSELLATAAWEEPKAVATLKIEYPFFLPPTGSVKTGLNSQLLYLFTYYVPHGYMGQSIFISGRRVSSWCTAV